MMGVLLIFLLINQFIYQITLADITEGSKCAEKKFEKSNNCAKYLECVNQGWIWPDWVWKLKECPENKIFDFEKKYCVEGSCFNDTSTTIETNIISTTVGTTTKLPKQSTTSTKIVTTPSINWTLSYTETNASTMVSESTTVSTKIPETSPKAENSTSTILSSKIWTSTTRDTTIIPEQKTVSTKIINSTPTNPIYSESSTSKIISTPWSTITQKVSNSSTTTDASVTTSIPDSNKSVTTQLNIPRMLLVLSVTLYFIIL